jgi:D-aspartate ligase
MNRSGPEPLSLGHPVAEEAGSAAAPGDAAAGRGDRTRGTRPAPVLLTKPDFYGSLAAARLFGQHGIPVTMADASRSATGSWSRHVKRRLLCPPLSEPEAFMGWLLDFGRREPGHVLYPTCDDLAWLFSRHRTELQRHFLMYSPPVEAMDRLLDKARLHELCRQVGIQAPRSWFPRGADDLPAIAREASYPLLVKRRTQVLSRGVTTKGTVVRGPAEIVPRFEEFQRTFRHAALLEAHLPGACLPLLQVYHPGVVEGTLLVAGFVDRTGRLVSARASLKILQQPRRLGIALCLEEAPLDPGLAQRLGALCCAAGHFGVFHVEFIREGPDLLLIDFNPRFYHHLAFEEARGLPLALLAYYGATGDDAALAETGRRARESDQPSGRAFTHALDLRVLVAGQRLTGHMSAAEARRWRRWYAEHRGRVTDAVSDAADRMPLFVDLAGHLGHWARHPRAFVRKILLDSI